MGENLKVLQDLMYNVGATVGNFPTSLECFTAELAVLVVRYVQSTLFQHYALFQYLFTEEQEEEAHATKVSGLTRPTLRCGVELGALFGVSSETLK